MQTANYIACPPGRQAHWLRRNQRPQRCYTQPNQGNRLTGYSLIPTCVNKHVSTVSSLQEISFEGELDNGATGQLVNLAPATGSPRASLKIKPSTATCLHSMRSGAQLMLYIHPQSPSIKIRTQRRHRWCVAALQRSIMHQDSRLISMIPKQGDRLTAAEEDWLLGNTMAHHHHAHTHAIHDTCMAQPSISNSAYSTRIVIHVPVQKMQKAKSEFGM